MLGLSLFLLLVSTLSFVLAEYDLMAFTVGQNQHQDLANATVISFPKLITNHKARDLTSGVFTCRTAGLYKFQVHSLTRTDKALYLDIFQNDVIVASLWAFTPHDYASAGNAVILQLATGDTVKVKSHTNQTVGLYGTTTEIYTTFSGVQLGAYQNPSGAQLVTFSVALNQPQTVAGGAPVIYNKAYVDTENAFNLNSGTFVAPNGGIYYIHLYGLARQDKMLWLELFHNSDFVISIYGLTKGERADAGNTAILHLRAGDQLQVRARPGSENTNELYGQSDEIFTTLSAYELYPENTLTTTRDGPKSYFSVGLDRTTYVKDEYRVVFNRVVIDTGDYDHTTGEFVAPVFGVYEFNYHALAENRSTVSLALFHNYKYINSLYSHTPIDYGAAGNSAVIEMDKNDVVYLRAFGDNNLFGRWDQVYCTFSGALLHSSTAKSPVVGK